MQHTFETNLKCESCLQRLKPVLAAADWVRDWRVDLQHPRKLLHCEIAADFTSDQASERMIELVARAGFTAAAVDAATLDSPTELRPSSFGNVGEPATVQLSLQTKASTSAEQSTAWWITYRPLLLVVAYILGLTTLLEWRSGTLLWHRVSAHFMGFFFLGFAFFKLLNVEGFANTFQTYDVVAKRSRIYAMAYPWLEVALGLMFLLGWFPLLANSITLAIMLIGLFGVVAAVRRKQAIQCACLGTVFNLPMSSVTIIENSIMALMAAAMIVRSFFA